jgi:hypothetical protein
VSADPRYEQYFVMLRLRVPVAAIKQKMMLEGINPDILEYAHHQPPPPATTTYPSVFVRLLASRGRDTLGLA